MSHLQYPSNSLLNANQNALNRRAQSFFTQTCSNYPPSSHLASTQTIKHPSSSSQKYSTSQYTSHSKENQTRPTKKTLINLANDDEVTQFKIQNERLRRQVQQQKDHYQHEIKILKKNITMKDQLLDECQAEIGHLKQTYQKFIISNTQGHIQTKQETSKVKQQHTLDAKKQKKNVAQQGNSQVQTGLIPLSIVPKRSSSLAHLPAQTSAQKLSHGLIKRVL